MCISLVLNHIEMKLNTLHAEPVYVNWAASAEFNCVRARARLIDSQNEPLPRIFCRITRATLRCQRNFRAARKVLNKVFTTVIVSDGQS